MSIPPYHWTRAAELAGEIEDAVKNQDPDSLGGPFVKFGGLHVAIAAQLALTHATLALVEQQAQQP